MNRENNTKAVVCRVQLHSSVTLHELKAALAPSGIKVEYIEELQTVVLKQAPKSLPPNYLKEIPV